MSSKGYKILNSDNDNQTREYLIDTESDLQKLPSNKFYGSFALCAETSNVYVLTTAGIWKKL